MIQVNSGLLQLLEPAVEDLLKVDAVQFDIGQVALALAHKLPKQPRAKSDFIFRQRVEFLRNRGPGLQGQVAFLQTVEYLPQVTSGEDGGVNFSRRIEGAADVVPTGVLFVKNNVAGRQGRKVEVKINVESSCQQGSKPIER